MSLVKLELQTLFRNRK